nr:SufD family Fe-S cluster assembly protein [Methanotorris igneus]
MLEDNAVAINNYVTMQPFKSMQMYPTAHCIGENSKVSFQTILYGKEKTKMDVGSRAILEGKGSSAEIISRVVVDDNAEVIARGHLVGKTENVKGHLECRGLILSDNAHMSAIPTLDAYKNNLELSHEAAVGKIAEEQVQYLMARGLNEDEATSLIIKGFLSMDIKGLPQELASRIKRIMDMTLENAL